MRMIDIINKTMEYNKLLEQIAKADIWFLDPKVPQEKKDNFYPKYNEAWERLGELSDQLDKLGITYKADEELNEVMEGIELPKELKRDKVEGFLENWNRILKEKEKEKLKVGT